MRKDLDLDAYFKRIGYQGTTEPSLSALEKLHALHPAAIPFENIDPLLGKPVKIDLSSVADKLLGRRRGGYCYEHNHLFCRALEALEFNVTPLAARVIWTRPTDGPRPPLTHRLTLVELGPEKYIADVGFGSHSPTKPLKLEPELEQQTSHGTYRLLETGGAYELQVLQGSDWAGLYRFTLEGQEHGDFEMSNWFTSTHPDSHFLHNLMMSRVVADHRLNLLNRRLTLRRADQSEERIIESAGELEKILTRDFGIDLAVPAQEIWMALPAAPPQS